MKIRIKGNTIRLRLSQSEVQQLQREGKITETTSFGKQAPVFSYSLECQADLKQSTATFTGSAIKVSLPTASAAHWASTEQVSLSEDLAIGDGETLSILVEKDFRCLTDRPNEDEADLFPHPKEGDIAC